MSKPDLLILAAGMGSRYGGLKQIDPVGPSGEIIMQYSAYDAASAGFGRVVFVIQRGMEAAFREAIVPRVEKHLEVALAFQDLADLPSGFEVPAGREKPWGTTHAILAARNIIRGPFCAINADDFYGRDAFHVIGSFLHTNSGSDYAMAGYRLRNTLSEHGSVSRGICAVDASQNLSSIREVTKIFSTPSGPVNRPEGGSEEFISGDVFVSMNCWGFQYSYFEHATKVFTDFLSRRMKESKSECYIPDVVQHLIQTRSVRTRVLPTTAEWHGVTYREDRPGVISAIQAMVERGEYPASL